MAKMRRYGFERRQMRHISRYYPEENLITFWVGTSQTGIREVSTEMSAILNSHVDKRANSVTVTHENLSHY
jgi:hypothetical protein